MKKNSRLLLIVILLMTIGMPVVAAEKTLATLMAGLANKGERQAFFIEERYASYLATPIKTQGRLRAIPPNQLEKIIVAPEKITQVVTGDHIIESRDNGATKKQISLEQVPALSIAINTLRAVVFGNLEYLQKTFSINYTTQSQRWALTLRPLSPTVRSQLKAIEVTGQDDTVTAYTVTNVNGDYSKTRLYENKKE